MVDAGFLGVSQGAAFGASAAIVFASGNAWAVQGGAALFAFLGLALSYALATRIRVGDEILHLVLAGMDWFLLAKDPGDDVVKTFYLSRMKSARVGSRRFTPPKGFRPEEHFGETIGLYVGRPRFRFRVRFAREIAEWVTEVRWHDKQKLVRLPDGSIELELPAGSLLEARRFVLSFGKHAEVLGPEELLADVKEHVRALAAVYGSAGD